MVNFLARRRAGRRDAGYRDGVPAAAPAMFVVRDADTTVYIFGTFHALDGQAQWFDDRSKNAFEQSTSWCSKR